MEVRSRSFARAGLLGNPSDGYFGKTIAFTFREFGVELRLTESSQIEFAPGEVDDASFDSPEKLVRDLRLYGYYGGIRMLKATAKVFFEYCMEHGIAIAGRNFKAEYKINIPRLVGLSGSSAICSAMLKALMAFYEVKIPEEMMATLVYHAERDELGIACGLQDRVAQVFNGLTFMDFNREQVEKFSYGRYERLSLDPFGAGINLYIAYDPNRAEESGKAHRKVLARFQHQDADVVSAMAKFADLAQRGRDLLVSQDAEKSSKLAGLINANFDLRDRIFNVSEENRRMVMVARSTGASAKFAGSGGAIVGTFEDEGHFQRLETALGGIGCRTFVPTIATTADESRDFVDLGKWRNS